MYLSMWAGCQYFKLFSLDVGFIAMIVVTAGMAAVALGRNWHRIALLSLFGGFLTPLLVSDGTQPQVVRFRYRLTLRQGFLAFLVPPDRPCSTPLAFLLSQ